MPLIQTALLKPNDAPQEVHQIYCGLDSALTLEIYEALAQHAENPIYAFERALQAPALDMMLRGWKVDTRAAITGTGFWVLYRVVRGWLVLLDRKAIA